MVNPQKSLTGFLAVLGLLTPLVSGGHGARAQTTEPAVAPERVAAGRATNALLFTAPGTLATHDTVAARAADAVRRPDVLAEALDATALTRWDDVLAALDGPEPVEVLAVHGSAVALVDQAVTHRLCEPPAARLGPCHIRVGR